jgi:hypothetical protein
MSTILSKTFVNINQKRLKAINTFVSVNNCQAIEIQIIIVINLTSRIVSKFMVDFTRYNG